MIVIGVSIAYQFNPRDHFVIRYAVVEQPNKLHEVNRTNAETCKDVDRFFETISEKYGNCPIVTEIQSRMMPLLDPWRLSTNISLVDVTKKKRDECLHVVLHDFSEYALQLDSDHIIALGLALLYRPPPWRSLQW